MAKAISDHIDHTVEPAFTFRESRNGWGVCEGISIYPLSTAKITCIAAYSLTLLLLRFPRSCSQIQSSEVHRESSSS
jgi:hypothetical protein